ncbi:MAG: imidazolonepropionase [Planctomycetota bacterium]|nr:MAG: imidazolonepropionase [Planctomycetota bacterium]
MSPVTLFVGIRELVPLSDGPVGAVRGEALGRAEPIPDAAIAVQDGKVLATGTRSDLEAAYADAQPVDLQAPVVVPAFVDAHTHPAFAATREKEFGMRCAGADYVEISKAGGGILSSVRTLREIDEDALVELVRERLQRFLALGTVALEAKSGYGLELESELKSLRAIERAAESVPMRLHRTFLGAHEIGPEYRDRPDEYVDLLVEEMLPAARPYSDACDVFVEDHVFTVEQGRRILSRAKELGYRVRAHVDELAPLGGAELAVELGADSADHLLFVSDSGIEALGGSETTAVLLPGTSFFLGKNRYAPARRLIEAGAKVALATDFNPGSCHTQSLPMIVTLARLNYGMTPAECLNAITRNAAESMGLAEERGTLHAGKSADFVVLELPSFEAFGYSFGDNRAKAVYVQGQLASSLV